MSVEGQNWVDTISNSIQTIGDEGLTSKSIQYLDKAVIMDGKNLKFEKELNTENENINTKWTNINTELEKCFTGAAELNTKLDELKNAQS